MNNYQIMIDRITELICKHLEKRKHIILIGENASGKSDVLCKVVEKNLNRPIYFIDSINRTFDANKVEFFSKVYENIDFQTKDTILDRINPFYFNLQDTFHAASCIEQLYDKYHSRIHQMCKMFLDKDIKIIREHSEIGISENKVIINGNEMKLSSGYQAAIRLFCEILFFADVLSKTDEQNGILIIDEADEYFSPNYSAKIMNFLQEQFPEMTFLATTHSLDLVKFTKHADLIVLHDITYEIYASQELETAISTEDIFTKIFFKDTMLHNSDNDSMDEKLRLLLNMKIAGLWDNKVQDELDEIDTEKILPHQKMIYTQIKEW